MNRVFFDPTMLPRMPAGHSLAEGFEALRWQALENRVVQAGETSQVEGRRVHLS